MSRKADSLKKYYGKSGSYLQEHTSFLASAHVDKDVDFLIKALVIRKKDTILDIACGQGRHANALSKRGYHVDGVDFSDFLLEKARESAGHNQKYYKANVEELKRGKKYDAAYWFFSDLANIDLSKAIESISRNIRGGGRVLIDTDSIFRVVLRLASSPEPTLIFDAERLMLVDKSNGVSAPYPTLPMWDAWLSKAGFKIERTFGNYDFEKYSIRSPRLIIVAKKIPSR